MFQLVTLLCCVFRSAVQ